MTSALEIRRPLEGEAGVLAKLHVTTWKQAYAGLLPPTFWDEGELNRRITMWSNIISTPHHRERSRVATWNGTPIGFGMIGESRDSDIDVQTELYMIYVLEEYHGTGAAHHLLTELVGEDTAVLWVFKDNPRAIAFYTKYGFQPDGAEKDLGVKEGDPSLTGIAEIRMVRHQPVTPLPPQPAARGTATHPDSPRPEVTPGA